ncbi:putative polysaccharide biosynthesis protein [Enterococcus caccae]|uniref:Polysaccharide biosynthesis family protein n=1 Tax=Enterococcus caccae ATCC BAA-1240 TaxID=1158612 RepID=R3TTW7_9ENTE|nr:polysaccharide biosynthesis protein [Enterococcus caccae]EOL44623.1 polysaccharide biosynthesis family protein [Enterococcus caccae ATCC BAA-1240]EOT58766.1 polysaccharide biosynthesis family protein [Enterococcus caccae ATCC BAA-1240]OJG25887.1 polysaccharide biosynthesis family protein [Enterococcus caccae]
MAHKEMRTMMQGAVVLTIASFIAKVLSAVYRVPFQNLVGDEGFYVYQQVYPIYGIAMTLALSGLPQFISKVVAEQSDISGQKKILQQLFPFVFVIAGLCWGFFFLGSYEIALMMGDSRLAPLIQIVSFTFLLVPILSFYRGNFQGHLLMIPSAVSQVMEQIVRVGVILIAAYSFSQFGWSVYQTGTVAMGGALLGGAVAAGILWYYDRKIRVGSSAYLTQWKLEKGSGKLVGRLVVEGGIVSIYSAFLILFQLIDSFLVKNSLVASGISDSAAKIDKGIYDRGQPLVQLGLVVALALSSSFLPALTKYFMSREQGRFLQAAKIFLRLTTTIATAASIGLALLLPYMNFALFKDYQGNGVLGVYVCSIAFMAVIQAYQSILQSKNQFFFSMLSAGVGLIVKLFLTGPLTYLWGTLGASMSTIIGLVATLVLLIFFSKKEINRFAVENHFFRKLIISLGLMGFVLLCYQGIVALLLGVVSHRGQALLITIIGVLVGGGSFLYIIIKMKLFTIREWLTLPFGAKILRMKR